MASSTFVHCMSERKCQRRVDRHNAGQSRPWSALTRAAWDHKPTVMVQDNRDAFSEARASLANSPKRRGRPGVERVRFLFGHPPAFESPDAWARATIEAWARDSARWLASFVERGSGGRAVLTRADLHVDEARPHVHATVFPTVANPDGRGVRLSWETLHLTATGASDAAESMKRIQDSYYEEVGKRYGMERGTPAAITGASRQAPDNAKGLRERARLAEERLEELQRAGRREREGAAVLRRELELATSRDVYREREEKRRDRGVERGGRG